jgi:transposase-like protein
MAMSGWQLLPGRGSLRGMMSSNPYRGFRFPPEVIQHALWLYHCFGLSLRDVELILAARGIIVRSERIREWESSGTILFRF